MKLLDTINDPTELRKLSRPELTQLADELREFVLHSVSHTGGHLSSNLGTIELTIALHYVFNTPDDKLIWDVGHQTYPHKILTGRRDQMASLRQLGGISGFPKRDESDYDAFGTAHSSTSISAALGMALAMRGKGEPAPQRPWEGAEGLEWEVPSPAPWHTYETPPKLDRTATKVIG